MPQSKFVVSFLHISVVCIITFLVPTTSPVFAARRKVKNEFQNEFHFYYIHESLAIAYNVNLKQHSCSFLLSIIWKVTSVAIAVNVVHKQYCCWKKWTQFPNMLGNNSTSTIKSAEIVVDNLTLRSSFQTISASEQNDLIAGFLKYTYFKFLKFKTVKFKSDCSDI